MTTIFRRYGLLTTLLILLSATMLRAAEPQLVVNIIVGSMRHNDIERYNDNLTDGGFRRLAEGGAYYTNAYYDFALTSTAAGLATFATGTQPSVHGAIGEEWWNYVDSSRATLIGDSKSHPVPFSTGAGSVSPHRLSAPTVCDMAKTADTNSKCYTVALDPLSAILLTGRNGVGFWPENNKTHWTTSSAYLHTTPEWVAEYNRNGNNAMYMLKRWTPICPAASYLNSEVAVIEDIKNKSTKLLTDIHHRLGNSAIDDMRYSPAGNTILLEFASTLIAQERLGADSAPDILNICLDTSRYIASAYGPESMEYEDMLYRLDRDLAEFLTYLYAQVDDPQKIVVVLTADHGTSPSYNPIGGKHRERFNVRQMEVIVNAFLGARYGSENYVLGFANNALYLNHQTILEKRLSLESIREEVATFLLQMRGVATAISASSLRNTSFADGRTRLLQQSFYATRSGDVVVDFMPGWIIEDSATRSASDAGYNYDRKVPLIIYGTAAKGRYDKVVSIVEVAPTITALLGIEQPWASTANPLKECITTK